MFLCHSGKLLNFKLQIGKWCFCIHFFKFSEWLASGNGRYSRWNTCVLSKKGWNTQSATLLKALSYPACLTEKGWIAQSATLLKALSYPACLTVDSISFFNDELRFWVYRRIEGYPVWAPFMSIAFWFLETTWLMHRLLPLPYPNRIRHFAHWPVVTQCHKTGDKPV